MPFRPLLAAALAAASAWAGTGCSRTVTAGAVHTWTQPGTLRIVLTQMPNSLDPLLRTELLELFLSQFVFDPLIATRADGTLEPKLARVVPTLANGGIARDGLTITYHLRPRVRWHDGAAFTSADVRFTYLAYMNPNNNVTTRTGYEDVERIATPDPLTVVVHLKRKSAPFLREFTTQGGVIPAHAFANPGALNRSRFNAAPIGTGPFKLLTWRRGDRIEWVANDDYYLGKPKIRRIVGRFTTDENVAENQLRTHEVDWFWGASTVAYRRLRDAPALHAALIHYNAFYGVMMNAGRGALRDVRVRRAVSAGIDRELLIGKVAFGAAQRADDDLPSFLWTHDAAFVGQRYDPARARSLLRAAGYAPGPSGTLQKDGKPLALTLVFGTGNATSAAVAVQVQAMLRALGFAIELKGYDANQMFAPYSENGILSRGTYDLNWSGFFETDDPDDATPFVCRNLPPHGFNYSRHCDPAFDAAEAVATATYDPAARKHAYLTVERLLAQDAPWAFVWWPLLPQIYDTDFKGYEVRPGFQSLDPQTWSIGT